MGGSDRGMHERGAGPLAGLRVLDLSTGIAGPYCTKLLVDAGADAIAAEPPGGDPLRRWSASGAGPPAGEDGALFRFLRAGVRSARLDPAADDDRGSLRALAARADVAIESFGPGGLEARGLAVEALREANPRLTLVSISPFGLTGPWAERPATEWTLQAQVGATGYRGLPERGPVAAGGRIGEWIAGTYAAVGALAGWLGARRGGRGAHVDLSLFESLVLSMTIYHDLAGQFFGTPLPQAIEIPSIEPTRDGWVGFCTVTGQQWKDFCALIEAPELAEDERFFDATARMQHRELVQGRIQAWTRQRSTDEIVELASLLRIPCNPIGNGRTLPAIDHFAARGVFVKSAHGFLQPRVPYRLHGLPDRAFRPAPRLGEHTEEARGAWQETGPAPSTPASAARQRGARSEPQASEAHPDAGDPLPLAGLRVLDLTAFWAGPVATCTLADLGADVVKVESIQRPDGMRFAGSVRNAKLWEWSPVFHGANPGKRDVTLRLDAERGIELVKRLVDEADVVVENFSVRVLEHFGLGWEAIRAQNPRAILVRMPAFGLDGPWRDRTGFAMNIEQVSGLAWITGYPDLPLVVRGACDPVGGLHAVFALLLALEERRRSGRGLLVEVPLVEPALNIAAEQVIEHSAYGALLERQGNRGPVAAPQGVYATAQDGAWLAVAVASDAQWANLAALLGEPWRGDPALREAAGRRAAHDAVDAALAAWLAGQERDAALAQLLGAGVPAAPVIDAHFLSPNPQLEARGFFQVMEHPETGPTRYPGLPMRFSEWPRALHRSPPPTLGQHNREILGGALGLSDDELDALREQQIIGDRPSFL